MQESEEARRRRKRLFRLSLMVFRFFRCFVFVLINVGCRRGKRTCAQSTGNQSRTCGTQVDAARKKRCRRVGIAIDVETLKLYISLRHWKKFKGRKFKKSSPLIRLELLVSKTIQKWNKRYYLSYLQSLELLLRLEMIECCWKRFLRSLCAKELSPLVRDHRQCHNSLVWATVNMNQMLFNGK